MQYLRFPRLTGRVGYFSLFKMSLAEVVASRTTWGLCGRLKPPWHSPLRLRYCKAQLSWLRESAPNAQCCCKEITQDRTKILPCVYHFSTNGPSFIRHCRRAEDTSKLASIPMPAWVLCNLNSPSRWCFLS